MYTLSLLDIYIYVCVYIYDIYIKFKFEIQNLVMNYSSNRDSVYTNNIYKIKSNLNRLLIFLIRLCFGILNSPPKPNMILVAQEGLV